MGMIVYLDACLCITTHLYILELRKQHYLFPLHSHSLIISSQRAGKADVTVAIDGVTTTVENTFRYLPQSPASVSGVQPPTSSVLGESQTES